MRSFGIQNFHPPRSEALVYLASPLGTYWTERYDRNLTIVRRRFSTAEILEPRLLFDGSAAWLAAWPGLSRELDALVFFSDTDGSIGHGVLTEVYDARKHSTPIGYLDDRGHFHDTFDFELIDAGLSWRRYARVTISSGAAE